MQVEYKKEWMDTYLWILPEHRKECGYEENMLLHNPGEGRLEFSRQEKEGEEYYCYKITGKKALNSIYAMIPIGERQIRSILQQLFSALESGKEYLLVEEDFLLSPNYIFATFPQMDIEFCYVPGYGVPLKEQLEGLFEYLLNRVDYGDKRAVELLYDCYMFCMKEEGGLPEIKKLLEREGSVEEVIPKKQPVLEEQPRQKTEAERPIFLYDEPEEGQREEQGSYFSWLTDKIFHKKRRQTAVVAEQKEDYKVKVTESAGIQQPALPEENTERTVLLSAIPEKEPPMLICEKSAEMIPLIKFPFYIGSALEYADYILKEEGVSRIHCCITKKEDNYYLGDLNSTNGTYLNGKEVMPGKEQLLAANDEIRIAALRFYLNFPCH